MSIKRKFGATLGAALIALALAAPAAQGSFGIETLTTVAREENKSPALQAGSHPFEYEVAMTLNLDAEGRPEGRLRDFIAEL